MIRQHKESEKSSSKNASPEQESEKGGSMMTPPAQLFAAAADAGSNKGNDRPVQKKESNTGMPSEVQEKMEGAFGQDFSDVKIHANSSESTKMGALAHAQGNEIHFAPGQYNPSSQAGQELLGHELTHVVQQREGRVKANAEAGGVAINNEKHLETEADAMGAKAAAGSADLKASPASKGGAQAKMSPAQAKMAPVQMKVLANGADKDEFFKQYRERAEHVLAGWYEKTKTKDGRDQLTGSLFENAARKIYEAKGDTKYIVPVEFALAQARLEGGVSRNERLGQGNIFNVGAYDSGVSGAEKKVNTLEKGFDAYYSFMANKMLDDKTPEQLLEKGNFTTGADRSGGVYATNPVYEGHIKGEIGKMNMKDAGFKISGSVGIGAKNNAADVEKVGTLLAQIGYLGATETKDAAKVGAAILKFQTTEIAPEGEKWFKDRMKWVTNPTDIKNMQIQLEGLKDGVVSNSGTTLGVIYYMSVMGGKVQTAGGTAPATAGSTTTAPVTAPTNTPTVKPVTPTGKPTTPVNTTTKPTTTTSWWEDAYNTVSDAASGAYDYVAGGVSSAYETVTNWGSSLFGGSEPVKKPVTPTTVNKPVTVTPPPPVGNSIKESVGKGGKNNKADVLVVQALLVKAGYLPATNSKGQTNIDGDCGGLTEGAIMKFQAEKAHLRNPDGVVDPNGTTWGALTGKPVVRQEPAANTGGSKDGGKTPADKPKVDVAARAATTGGDIYETIKTNNPNGITVSLYANYAKTGDKAKDGNNAEFPRAAGSFAKNFNSIGIDAAGQLKIGMAVPITSLDEITSSIKGITEALFKEYKKTNPDATEAPAFSKIHRLCLFSHGMQWGMHLGASGRYNLRIDSEEETKKFKTFVAGIRGSLSNDVVVDLFACNAGRESDGTEKEGVWGYDAANKQDGSSSFAAAFAEQLGKDASVYGHLSAGHTVNNYSARVFGKDAGKDATKDKGGVHIFDILYPQTFIDAEALRLKKDAATVKLKMWKHYTQRMSDGHEGKFSITNGDSKTEKVELGAEMFADVNRAKTILQTDWVTWVASNPIK